jgi:hypothetical protein
VSDARPAGAVRQGRPRPVGVRRISSLLQHLHRLPPSFSGRANRGPLVEPSTTEDVVHRRDRNEGEECVSTCSHAADETVPSARKKGAVNVVPWTERVLTLPRVRKELEDWCRKGRQDA